DVHVDGIVVGDQLDHVVVDVDLERHQYRSERRQFAVDWPVDHQQRSHLVIDVHVDGIIVGDQLDHVVVYVDVNWNRLAVDRSEHDRQFRNVAVDVDLERHQYRSERRQFA
ncbi:hypothetical protein, partial [Burkholderia pseudomallei]|uniref:hypothetical protein n=1 Tax=Burkholderia pseudomallei TaxID=28450 RepID=UPI00274213F6